MIIWHNTQGGELTYPTSSTGNWIRWSSPPGYVFGAFRVIVSANLILAFMEGLKWATTRAWCESQELLLRRSWATNKLVRLQSNWANNTIRAWGVIESISARGPPNKVVTRRTVIEAGCGKMTTESYCRTYLMDCQFVFTIYFKALWTVEGTPIRRHPSMPTPSHVWVVKYVSR